MTCEEYLSNMKPGYIVDGGSEEHLVMHELSQRALKITMELNNKYHTTSIKDGIAITARASLSKQISAYLVSGADKSIVPT